MMTRSIGRFRTALFTALAATVVLAAPTAAHVTVSSTDASQGGYGMLTFRVPNESDTAATTKLTITLPSETPLAHVTAQSKPGWKVTTDTTTFDEPVKVGDFELTEAVTSITWTATGGGIPVGGFDTFAISGGPLPASQTLVLPATQTYDDGDVVAWDQTGDGAERPAPTLTLTEGGGGHSHGAAAGDDHDEASPDGTAQDESDQDGSGFDVLSIVAIVLAAVALVVAVQNRRRA